MDLGIKNQPIIDVIIPVYNGERFVLEAVRSAEAQTLKPRKIIVVDDGSTDNTKKIVSEYAYASNSSIMYIKKENAGPNSARNAGIHLSDADFLAFLDADDEWHKNKLEEQIKVFQKEEFKKIGVVYCNFELINESGNKIKYDKKSIRKDVRGNIFEKLLRGNTIMSSASGVLIKRECFLKSGYFDETLRGYEDWDMWLRLAEHYEFDYADMILVKIRRHSGNHQRNTHFMLMNEITFFNKWTARLEQKQVPSNWKDYIPLSIFLSRGRIFKYLKITKEKLDRRCYDIFYGKYGSLEIYFVVFLFKSLYLSIKSPRKFINKLFGILR